MYGTGGPLLTSTEDIVREWKEYFEDLDPTDTSSVGKAKSGDKGDNASITGDEVTEEVK